MNFMDGFEISVNSLLLNFRFQVLCVVIFLLFLYLLSKFVEKRESEKLKTFSLFYDFLRSGLSFITLLSLLYELTSLQISRNFDLFVPCNIHIKGALFFWCFVSHVQNYLELIDACLIVLRKNQDSLLFLHIFHRAIMVMFTNWAFASNYGGIWVTTLASSLGNTLVHFYGGLTVQQVRREKEYHITCILTVEFCTILGMFLFLTFIPGGLFNTCSGNLSMVLTFHSIIAVLLSIALSFLKRLKAKQYRTHKKTFEWRRQISYYNTINLI